jgi:hypothetical protein
MTKLKKVNIPKDKWVQIGGDVNYEQYGLILGKYDPNSNEINVVEIDYDDESKLYLAHESTYDINELKQEDLEKFGINPKDYKMKRLGLELVAEEKLTQEGGDPIQCGAGFYTQYKSEFKDFNSALACAIGSNESFEDWSGNEVKPEKECKCE